MHHYEHFWLDPKFWVAVSFVIFLLVRGVHRMLEKQTVAEDPQPAVEPADVVLLREILEELKRRP